MMDQQLLDIIVDPQDQKSLLYFENVDGESWFYNDRRKVRYPVTEQISVLLADEAESVSDDDHARFLQLESVRTGPKGLT